MMHQARRPDASFLHFLADAADAETMLRFRTNLDVETKVRLGEAFDPVTEADRAAERALRALIQHAFPSHGIWGEEYGQSTGNSHHVWVLDPIDGTRPFLCGIPVWATLIGLTSQGRASMGMMSQPFTRERFWATPKGSWQSRDGEVRLLHTRKIKDLSTATLHTTSPVRGHGPVDAGFEQLSAAVRLTRYGSEAYAAAMLAAGLIDLCFEPAPEPYDIVALIPIIEQAGGIVTTLDGERPEAGGAVLMSGSTYLHEAALRLLAER